MRFFKPLFCACCLSVFSMAGLAEPFDCKSLRFLAHRGYGKPENSLASFMRAKDAGFDGVEFDVQPLSKGGAWVVHHDIQLGRVVEIVGREREYGYLAAININDWLHHARFTDRSVSERPPFLESVMLEVDNGFDFVFIEAKGVLDLRFSGDLLQSLDNVLGDDRFTVISMSSVTLVNLRSVSSKISLGYVVLHPSFVAYALSEDERVTIRRYGGRVGVGLADVDAMLEGGRRFLKDPERVIEKMVSKGIQTLVLDVNLLSSVAVIDALVRTPSLRVLTYSPDLRRGGDRVEADHILTLRALHEKYHLKTTGVITSLDRNSLCAKLEGVPSSRPIGEDRAYADDASGSEAVRHRSAGMSQQGKRDRARQSLEVKPNGAKHRSPVVLPW